MRNESLAEQGSAECSYRDSCTRPATGRAHSLLPDELGSNNSGPVGTTDDKRLQDKVPSEAKAKPQAFSNYLHKEGRRVHAGGIPEHVRQTGYISISETENSSEGFYS